MNVVYHFQNAHKTNKSKKIAFPLLVKHIFCFFFFLFAVQASLAIFLSSGITSASLHRKTRAAVTRAIETNVDSSLSEWSEFVHANVRIYATLRQHIWFIASCQYKLQFKIETSKCARRPTQNKSDDSIYSTIPSYEREKNAATKRIQCIISS